MDSNSMNTFAGSVHHKIKNKFKEARTTTDAVVESNSKKEGPLQMQWLN
jgi:hypothetical protein